MFLHVFIFLAIFCFVHEGDNGVLIQPVVLGAHELNVSGRVSINRQVMVLKLAEDIFDSPLIFIDKFVDLLSEIFEEESCFFDVSVHDRVFGLPGLFEFEFDVVDGGDLGFGVFVRGEIGLVVEEEGFVAVLGEADAGVLFGGVGGLCVHG